MKKRKKILIGPSSFSEADKTPLETLLSHNFDVINNPYRRKLSKEELIELLPGVSGLIAGLETLDREVLEKSDLKVISRCGSGLSNVDLESTRELNIVVCNTPLGPVTAVAELTIGCLLSLVRQVPQMDWALHQGQWSKRIGKQLQNSFIAVIGFGNIGRRVAQLLYAFGSKVLAVDPFLSDVVENVTVVGLKEALEKADIITLHVSGEECLLGKGEFNLMKEGVYILNAARGGLIDENALKNALDSNKVAGAWIDTFNEEPYNGPLCKYQQVILTPHIGSYTFECRRSMEMEAVKNLLSALEGYADGN